MNLAFSETSAEIMNILLTSKQSKSPQYLHLKFEALYNRSQKFKRVYKI